MLHAAVAKCSRSEVKALLKRGADVDSKHYVGQATPLTVATSRGSLEMTKLLLSAGADPLLRSDGDSPIHTAAQLGHTHLVREYVRVGISLEVESADGSRPLFIAAQNGHAHTVRYMIDAGADMEHRHEGHYTALYMACQCGKVAAVQVLLDAGAYTGPQGKHGFTPLIQACCRGHYPVVKALLAHGCPLDVQNHQGCTALHLAASTGRADIVEELLRAGSEPSGAGGDGFTPYDIAKQEGHTEVMRLLVKAGKKGMVPDKNAAKGDTPLHVCVLRGDVQGICMLLEEGAPVEERNADGMTPLQLALYTCNPMATKTLLENGANAYLTFNSVFGPVNSVQFGSIMAQAAPKFIQDGDERGRRIVMIDRFLACASAFGAYFMWPLSRSIDSSFGSTGLAGEIQARQGWASDTGAIGTPCPQHVRLSMWSNLSRYIKKANDRRDGVNVAVFEGGTNKLMESLHTSDRSVIGV